MKNDKPTYDELLLEIEILKKQLEEKNHRQDFQDEELTKAQGKAAESEYILKVVVDNSYDGMNMLDLATGKYIFMNDAQVQLTGFDRDEILNISAEEAYDRMHPDDRQISVQQQLDLMSGKADSVCAEYRWKVKGGEYRWFSDSRTTVKDQDGKITALIGVSRDITERKLQEEELRTAKEEAEEREKLKTAYLQNMSHEIRTPLSAISWLAGLLNKPELPEEKRRSFIQIIRNSSHLLGAIVHEALTVSSLEAKQAKLNVSNVCINHTMSDLLVIFKQQAVEQHVSLYEKHQMDDRHSTVFTDHTKLTQILSNLLSNALKFTQQGFVEFGYALKDSNLEFYVKDSGIGIHPEFHTHIFERFKRAGKTANQSFAGTGLGLAISRSFVESMGGKIWVESESGKGAAFYFTIPYKPVNEADEMAV